MAKRGGGCLRVVVLAFLIPILIGLGLWLASNLNRVLTHDRTEGVVVDLLYSIDSDGDLLKTPVYRYVVDGQTYEYEGGVAFSANIAPSLGSTRAILYNPSDPADARIHNLVFLIGLPIILMIIPILIAVGIFWGIRKRSRMQGQAPPWADQQPVPSPSWDFEQATPPAWEAGQSTSRSVIDAMFMGAEPSQMDAAGKVRYRVKARAEINGEIVRFRSEWTDEDPTLHYMQHGNKVEVNLNPDDPTVYEVVLPDGS